MAATKGSGEQLDPLAKGEGGLHKGEVGVQIRHR